MNIEITDIGITPQTVMVGAMGHISAQIAETVPYVPVTEIITVPADEILFRNIGVLFVDVKVTMLPENATDKTFTIRCVPVPIAAAGILDATTIRVVKGSTLGTATLTIYSADGPTKEIVIRRTT